MEIRNELERIEKVIGRYLISLAEIESSELQMAIIDLKGESQRFQEAVWQKIYFHGLDKPRIATYLDYLFIKTSNLIDESANRSDLSKYSLNQELLKVEILAQLNTILDYLRGTFGIYLNKPIKVPKAYVEHTVGQFTTETEYILCTLSEQGVDYELIEVLKSYFLDPLAKEHYPGAISFGFHRLDYFQVLVKSLYAICVKNKIGELEPQIKLELFYLNFNLLDYIWLSIRQLRVDKSKVTDIQFEINQLTIKRNDIIHLPMRHKYGYEPNSPSVKEVQLGTLKEEIKYFRHKLTEEKDNFLSNRPQPSFNDYYFEIAFTIKEFLFLNRLLIETGYMILKNRNGLYRFIATHIRTKKHSGFSQGSLSRKYNEEDNKEITKIKSALLEMLKLINEKYIPITVFYYGLCEACCFLPIL